MSEAATALTNWAREYETIYILNPETQNEQVGEVNDRVKGIIEERGGKIVKVDNWGKRRLAYEIEKQRKGIYLYWQYLGNPEIVDEFERHMRLMDSVIRYMTVRIDEDIDPSKALGAAGFSVKGGSRARGGSRREAAPWPLIARATRAQRQEGSVAASRLRAPSLAYARSLACAQTSKQGESCSLGVRWVFAGCSFGRRVRFSKRCAAPRESCWPLPAVPGGCVRRCSRPAAAAWRVWCARRSSSPTWRTSRR